jgi:DNA-binding MarR family transcriptional regulator
MAAPIPTPNFDRIKPRDCINAKLRRLHRQLNRAYEQKLRPFGLKGSMLSILFWVGKSDGVNQKSLAKNMVLDPSTMSRDLKKLVEKGWMAAEKGDDPRNTIVKLTKEGYLLLEEVCPIWEAMHNKVSTLLGTFNVQQIDAISLAITQNFDALSE